MILSLFFRKPNEHQDCPINRQDYSIIIEFRSNSYNEKGAVENHLQKEQNRKRNHQRQQKKQQSSQSQQLHQNQLAKHRTA